MRIPVVRRPLAAALLASAILFPPPAAADELVDATDPERLVSILRGLGQQAQLETDPVGDPLIRSSVEGTQFSIQFYGCDEQRHDRCDFLLFRVGYDLEKGIDLERINEWNANRLMGRAFRDEDNDPWLELPWSLEGGVTARNFQSTVEWWETAVAGFEDHIQF